MKKGSLFVPEINESFPMSEELNSIQPLIAGNEQAEPSLPSVSEVEERVRTYLEQHGWPEEYELEFLLEHYALLDWLAVSLSFHRPQSTKKIIIYGLIKQAKKSIPERVPPSLSGFDPPLKAYRWQADLLSFYFGYAPLFRLGGLLFRLLGKASRLLIPP